MKKTMFGKSTKPSYSLVKKDRKFIIDRIKDIHDELNAAESIMISSRTFKSKKDSDALPKAIYVLAEQLDKRKRTYSFNNAIMDLNEAHNIALEVCKNLRCTIGNRNERNKIKRIRSLIDSARKSIEYELDGKLDQK